MSQFWKLKSPKLGSQLIWLLVRSLFLAYKWLVSSLCLLMTKRAEISYVTSSKDTNPIMMASLLWPTCHSKVPPPNTITLGIRGSTYELFGGINIHSIKRSETFLHKRQINNNNNKTHTHWKKKCVKTKLFRILEISQGLQQYEQCLFTKNSESW